MSRFLLDMALQSQQRAGLIRSSARELRARANDGPLPRHPRLNKFDLIAEIKLSSPSIGLLVPTSTPLEEVTDRARAYAGAGATALSVLTETSRFGGHVSHLCAARQGNIPIMRKDFLVDSVQVLEARAWGADGVLLIARMLPDDALLQLLSTAQGLGMFVLLEVFDEHDLDRCLRTVEQRFAPPGSMFVGVNTRNLETLQVDSVNLPRLISMIPAHIPAVAESGLASAEDVAHAAAMGYRLALVGTALSRASDASTLCHALIDAGRKAVCPRLPIAFKESR